jgi:transcriptional regulator with XRE-family HTH domain
MRDDALAKDFGELVRRLRLQRGYSQATFAEAAKIDRAHMGEIERGEVTVTIVTARKIAQALGMTLADLFRELEQDR